MTEPLVSFLLPIAPRSPWLAETLESIKDQSYKNWELIAVLDGISPHNLNVISQAAIENPVQILTHDLSLGISKSLNDGLTIANGELVARIDADDINLPTRIEQQVQKFAENPKLVLLGGSALVIDENGMELEESKIVPTGCQSITSRLLLRNALIHPTVMFRKNVVELAGGYNPICTRTEDYDLWLRIATMGQVDNLSNPVLKYRVHSNQHTSGSAIITYSEAKQIWQSRKALGRKLGSSYLKILIFQLIWFGNRYLKK
jgi:glycosyltransferase involved in cell wall biosynthesis